MLCILALSVLIGPYLAERLRIPGPVGINFTRWFVRASHSRGERWVFALADIER